LIGGLPLLQTLAIMFTGKPIPFAKLKGMFADTALGQFLSGIKKDITKGIDAVKNFFAQNFINPLKNALNSENFISSPLNDLNQELEFLTANNYAGMQAALPLLFSNTTPSVVTARNELLSRLGQVKELNTSSNFKIGPFTIGELNSMADEADSLARTLQEMEQHTDNLSGLGGAQVKFRLERITGNLILQNTSVHIVSSNVVYANLSQRVYPVVNIGDTIVIDTQERVVIDKKFTPTFDGTVSINTSANSYKLTTTSIATLNLASCNLSVNGGIGVLETGNLVLAKDMFISVNGEVRQVNTINSLGDYLTVYAPFDNSVTGSLLLKETSFNVNSAFTTTNEELIRVKTSFVANSTCLDNVITGQGTTFTSQLQPNNKIIYDSKEYIVKSVTNTTIEVEDDWLRYTVNFPIFKVVEEVPFLDLTEDLVDPDGILTAFTLPGQIMGDENVLVGLTTKVRRANGIYQSVSASKPTDAAQALFQKELMRRTKEILTQMKYDLRNDAIRGLASTTLVQRINETETRILNIKNDIKNVVEQDIAVLNQVKGIVKGMIKLFSMSCSKKKRKDEGRKTDSDDYLDLILQPNPDRQGCSATGSDFIDILDDFDKEYNDPDVSSNNTPTVDTTIPTTDLFDGLDGITGPFPRQPIGPAGGDNTGGDVDDQDPDVNVPEDPCAKPC
jgi:hypothetical protein